MRFIHFFPYLSSKILEIYVKAREAALPDACFFFVLFCLFFRGGDSFKRLKNVGAPRKRFHVLGWGEYSV